MLVVLVRVVVLALEDSGVITLARQLAVLLVMFVLLVCQVIVLLKVLVLVLDYTGVITCVRQLHVLVVATMYAELVKIQAIALLIAA
jgi:hypothetical protein